MSGMERKEGEEKKVPVWEFKKDMGATKHKGNHSPTFPLKDTNIPSPKIGSVWEHKYCEILFCSVLFFFFKIENQKFCSVALLISQISTMVILSHSFPFQLIPSCYGERIPYHCGTNTRVKLVSFYPSNAIHG